MSRYTFLNAGFGDTVICRFDSALVMVDCYETEATGVLLRDAVPEKRIDHLILTHRHFDHYFGIEKLLASGITVGTVWESCWIRKEDDQSIEPAQWAHCQELVDVLHAQGSAVRKLSVSWGMFLDIDGYQFTVLNPPDATNEDPASELHDGCLVVRMVNPASAGEMMLCGDANLRVLDKLANSGTDPGARILMCSHHGALDSYHEEFVKKVDPEITVISSLPGTFGLIPEQVAIDSYARLSRNGIRRTWIDGTIELE